MSKKRKHPPDSCSDLFDHKARKKDRRLYCLCKQPDDPSRVMIQCDFCDEWFHPGCVDLDDDEADDIAKWFCPGCTHTMAQNPLMSRKGLLGFQGRVAPKEGWSEDFPIKDIDELVIHTRIETKRHRVEGWNLFREGRVTGLSSNKVGNIIYFRSQCQASMRQQSYNLYLCFKNDGERLKWATCSCSAGIDGQCKHLVATLHCIIDIYRQGVSKIPDVKTCTDKLQMWHVRRPITDEPLLFSDISFVKHEPDKPVKRDLCCSVRSHNPVPEFASTVTEEKLNKLVSLFDMRGLTLPVLETIKDNKCVPVMPKQQTEGNLYTELFNSLDQADINFNIHEYTNNFTSSASRHYNAVINIDMETSKYIEKKTRLQSKSRFWFEQREHRITASNFGAFCRMRETTDPVKTFKQKKCFFSSRSVRHGLDYESAAFAKYTEVNSYVNCPVGLVVNPKLPFLGVTPDRLVLHGNELRLVEIKCPYTLFQKKMKLSNQVKEKNFFIKKENGTTTLSRTHDYFYQIQGQLNITGISACDLVVFVPPDDILIFTVEKDKNFFETEMLPKLSSVYFNRLLPSFVEELQSTHI